MTPKALAHGIAGILRNLAENDEVRLEATEEFETYTALKGAAVGAASAQDPKISKSYAGFDLTVADGTIFEVTIHRRGGPEK